MNFFNFEKQKQNKTKQNKKKHSIIPNILWFYFSFSLTWDSMGAKNVKTLLYKAAAESFQSTPDLRSSQHYVWYFLKFWKLKF